MKTRLILLLLLISSFLKAQDNANFDNIFANQSVVSPYYYIGTSVITDTVAYNSWVRNYIATHGGGGGGGGSMVYPGLGIPNSTGSSWGTSYSVSGSGTSLVTNISPSFVSPSLGAALATTINGLNITSNTIGFTLTGGTTSKYLKVNNSINLSGTDGVSINLGATSGTLGSNAFTNIIGYTTNWNVTLGANSIPSSTTGINNVAEGYSSLQNNSSGNSNTSIGNYSLENNSTGGANTCIGSFAGYNNYTGTGITAIGTLAGYWETAGNAFYVNDGQSFYNSAAEKTGSLIYGTFNATPASQTLALNAAVQATYGMNIPSGQTYKINGTALAPSNIGAEASLGNPPTDGWVLSSTHLGLRSWEPQSGGLTNPMTSVGDIIIGGTLGAPARLGIGSTGQALIVTSGTPTWGSYAYKNLQFSSTDTISLSAKAPISISSGSIILDTTSTKGVATYYDISQKENSLGNPSTTGYVLASTTTGTRSWVALGSASMVYPSSGIASSNGSAWNTSYGTSGTGTTLALTGSPTFTGSVTSPTYLTGTTVTSTTGGTTTLTASSNQTQIFTGNVNNQTIVLPVASTLVVGQSFTITNATTPTSSGKYLTLTLNSSGGNLVQYVCYSQSITVTCILNSGTTAASWNVSNNWVLGNNTQGNYIIGPGLLTNQAFSELTTGTFNLSVGSSTNAATFYELTSGTGNVGVGYGTNQDVSTGLFNTSMGFLAGNDLESNNWNTAIGAYALNALGTDGTSGNWNTAVGYYAGYTMKGGSNNTYLGVYAGSGGYSSGSNNIYLGMYSGYYSTGSNQLMINNYQTGSLGGDTTNSIIYGAMRTSPYQQRLTFNANTTSTYGFNIPTGQTYKIGGASIFTSPTISSPTLNGTVSGTGVSSSSSAGTVAVRDGVGNIAAATLLQNVNTLSSGNAYIVAGTNIYSTASTLDVYLPSTTSVIGQCFTILNGGGSTLTIHAAGGATVGTLLSNGVMLCYCLYTSGTTAAMWVTK